MYGNEEAVEAMGGMSCVDGTGRKWRGRRRTDKEGEGERAGNTINDGGSERMKSRGKERKARERR